MMSSKNLADDVRPREIWAWAMYDFANSGYTTVVITAIFNAYFVAVVAEGKDWGTLAWSGALALSYFLVMLAAPALGAYADAYASKKRLLLASTFGCVLFTAGLALVGRGDLYLAIPLVILSNFFFGVGENLIAAFLPELAKGEAMGKVSGWGWSIGFVGGLLSLGASLAYVTWAEGQGQAAAQFVPVTMLITASLFVFAALPTFLILRERAVPQPHLQGRGVAGEAFARLGDTLHHARRYRDLGRFLLSLVCYQAGIQAVIALAAIYAQQAMHFGTRETIMLVLLVNVTAAVGAFLFGQIQDRLGHIRTIALTLVGWILMILIAYGADTPGQFWIAANITGLCLGSSQSAGRALVGYMSPPQRSAEFFGLWGLAVKLSSILGPLTYGLVSWMSRGDHRLAMLLTGGYFLVGLLLLLGVNAERGRRAALLAESSAVTGA